MDEPKYGSNLWKIMHLFDTITDRKLFMCGVQKVIDDSKKRGDELESEKAE